MGRLLSRFAVSPRAKQRARVISALLFALVAALNWWSLAEDGPSPARLITAIVASVAVILDLVLPKRRRPLRRSPSGP